jgi:DUF1680 family protein
VAMGLLAASSYSAEDKAMAGKAPIAQPHRLTPVPISQVSIDDPFWSPKLKTWREVTINDCFTKFENDRGGAINNFDLVRDGKTGQHAGPPWYDGLIYEMITGAADYLAEKRDAALEARIDGYIARIVAAQAKDPVGYLNTWTQSMAPQSQRWGMNGGDDRGQHDVYNAGMMIEAGVHYYRATGKAPLLEAATKMANLMCDTIGPSPKANVVPGHSGPEDALVKLYLLYRDDPAAVRSVSVPVNAKGYLELAQFFIDARGRHEGRTGKDKSFGDYGQDRVPLAQQTSLEGHAVRATLFCAGIAALADVTDRADYYAAAQRFWDSYINHKMYITGAGGAIGDDEKFGPDYFLPNDGYMETCAAVSSGFFNRAMNLLYGDARYIDELERALYNAIPGGVALAGDHYYYQNPLTGNGLRRWEWHDCPCCPPMFLKITGALPGYIYAQEPNAAYVNLFIGSRATLDLDGTKVTLKQMTRYPWEGQMSLSVDTETPAEFDLFVRVPRWCQGASSREELYQPQGLPAAGAVTLSVNGSSTRLEIVRGYARLHRLWKAGDIVELHMDMPVRQVKANSRVEADTGRVALTRGPVVYCVESADNPQGVGRLFIDPKAVFTADYEPNTLGGVAVVRGKVRARVEAGGKSRTAGAELTAVPFYASANREPGAMNVWMPAEAKLAVPATLAFRSRPSASHCWHLDSVAAINDGVVPSKSSDTGHPRLSWWDHKGTSEWAELAFPEPAQVSKARVFWFADRDISGGCDLPASWRLLYKDGDNWVPVANAIEYGVAPDRFNEVTFNRVKTTALRVEVQLKPGWSGGICEWQVE